MGLFKTNQLYILHIEIFINFLCLLVFIYFIFVLEDFATLTH